MEEHDSKMRLEERMMLLLKEAEAPSVSLEKIANILSGKGQCLMLMLLSLPFCQPLQIPGLSTPFGMVIAFIGLRLSFGNHIQLPQKVRSTQISSTLLKKMAKSTLWFVGKVQFLMHARLQWICQHPVLKKINGLMIVVLGLFLALPLPIPLSNVVAAWLIFLISLGILEDDGLFVVIGYGLALLAFVAFIFIFFQIGFLFSFVNLNK